MSRYGEYVIADIDAYTSGLLVMGVICSAAGVYLGVEPLFWYGILQFGKMTYRGLFCVEEDVTLRMHANRVTKIRQNMGEE